MPCLSLDVANTIATRTFPVVFFLIHISFVSLWVGGDDCDNTDMHAFTGYFVALLFASAIFGLYLSWKSLTDKTCSSNACTHMLVSTVSTVAYLAGIAMQRAKPFKCYDNGDMLAYAYGPAVVWVTYVCSLGYGMYLVRSSSRAHVEDYASLSADKDGGTPAPSGFQYMEMMVRALAADTRRKFPLAEVLFHYAVVTFFIGGRGCDETNMTGFTAYLCALLVFKFVRRVVQVRRYQLGISVNEKLFYALTEGLQATTLLFAIVLNRAKPVKCYAGTGVALAYAVSTPLLWFALVWGVVSSYLVLRNYSLDRLSEIARGFVAKTD